MICYLSKGTPSAGMLALTFRACTRACNVHSALVERSAAGSKCPAVAGNAHEARIGFLSIGTESTTAIRNLGRQLRVDF